MCVDDMDVISYRAVRPWARGRNSFLSQNLVLAPQRNPLLIDLVLISLTELLDYESLKNSRLVCTKWKVMFDRAFMKKSTFSYTKYCRSIQLIPPGMILSFPEPVQSLFVSINPEYRLTAFEFELYMLKRFKVVGTSFDPNMLTYLKIVNWEPVYRKDYSLTVDYLIGPNLRTLELHERASYKECHPWLVSLKKLRTIDRIVLENVLILMFTDDLKISPIELKLSQCSRCIDASITWTMPLQEMVDFSKLQRLHVDGSFVLYYKDGPSQPIVNLSDCSRVTELCLIQTNIMLDAIIYPKRHYLMYNIGFLVAH